MIPVGSKVTHTLSKGHKRGVVIVSSGAPSFRNHVHVEWFESGIADYILPRFLLVDGEQSIGLPEIEDLLVSVEESEETQAEECAEGEEPEAIENGWEGFTLLEDLSQEIEMGRVA